MWLLACRFFLLWVCCRLMWRGFCCLRFCCRVFLQSVLLCGLLSVASCCLVVLLFVALCSSSVWCCCFSSLLGRICLSCCLVVAGCSAFGSLVTSCPDLRYGLFLLFCCCSLFCLLCWCSFLIVSLLSSFLLMWSLLSVGFYSFGSSFCFSWFFFLMAWCSWIFVLVWFLLSFLKSAVHADLPARRTAWPVLLQAMP